MGSPYLVRATLHITCHNSQLPHKLPPVKSGAIWQAITTSVS
jgi:hypothetical protein